MCPLHSILIWVVSQLYNACGLGEVAEWDKARRGNIERLENLL
jgi:hypothetical protein